MPGDQTSTGAVRKAMHLLLYKNRSEKELRSRLQQGGFAEDEIDEAIEYVSSYGYLNDRRYAESYAHTYAGRKSRCAIQAGLRSAGVAEQDIEAAMEELPSDEAELMAGLLEKRAGMPHRLSDQEKRRLAGFFARRGFRTQDIFRAMRLYEAQAD